MSVLCQASEGKRAILFVKGAPEAIIAKSTQVLTLP